MANEAVASLLREMAFFGELKGDNPFKIRAWQKSADLLEEQGEEAEELVRSGAIGAIPGIGKGTQALVKEFVESGKIREHEELKSSFPPRLLELTEVRGLGPKKIKALYDQLGIASLVELEYACEENRLLELKGFGKKTQENILENISRIKANRGKAILPAALQQSETVRDELERLPGVKRAEETGELRRLMPVISGLDFLLEGEEGKWASSLEKTGFHREDGRWIREQDDALPVRIFPAGAKNFGTLLLESTGPESFLKELGKLPDGESEEKVFAALSLEPLPPECRDLGKAPPGLIEEKDIRGVFHLHTQWSDGKNTLEEMAAAAVDCGYEYIGVSEHSQTAFYANGLNAERVKEQRREIDRLQGRFPSLRIFQGIESDILADGSLDFPDSVLKSFDFVIASVHGQMRMSSDDMTRRLCRVLEHPATTWLGHWTGRLLLGREGFSFDQDKVLKAAAKNGKGIELNSNPYRLDMDWSIASRAAGMGVSLGIFPDAHSTGGLKDVKFGVWMARKAGLKASSIVNTKTRREMESWLEERKFR